MSPFKFSSFGRDGAARGLLTAVIAALVGTIVGGLSVLGIVLAVITPPNHDSKADPTSGAAAPSESATPAPRQTQTDSSAGAATTVPATDPSGPAAPTPAVQAPTAPTLAAPTTTPPAPAQAPTSAALATASAPPSEQASPAPAPAAPAAQGPQPGWPDALTRRSQQVRQIETDKQIDTDKAAETQKSEPLPPPAAPTAAVAAAPANDQAHSNRQDARQDARGETDRQQQAAARQPAAPGTRAVVSRARAQSSPNNAQPSPNNQLAKGRVVTPPPAPSRQTVTVETTTDAVADAPPRPLFDFFGLFGHDTYRDEGDDRGAAAPPQGDASRQPASQQTQIVRDPKTGARKQLVRQRPNDANQSGQAVSTGDDDSGQSRGGLFDQWHRDNGGQDDWHQDGWHHDNWRQDNWNDH